MSTQEPAIVDELSVMIDGAVARITISRPQKKNALTFAMWQRLAEIVTSIDHDENVRVIVISGDGADFCAGADISEFDTLRGTPETAAVYEAANADAFAAIRHARVPVIAAISGICFGGGFGIAAACQLRIASPDAVFCVPAAKLGLAYPVDAMVDIVQAVGPQMARYLTFSAARIDADAALGCGMLLEIIERKQLQARALELAGLIAGNAPLSVAASGAAIKAVLTGSISDFDVAKSAGDRTFESADYAEGRQAFKARRAPVFLGL